MRFMDMVYLGRHDGRCGNGQGHSGGGIGIAAARGGVDREDARTSLAGGPGGQAKRGLIGGIAPGSGFGCQLTDGEQLVGGLMKLGGLLPQPCVDRGGRGVQQPGMLPLMLQRPDLNLQRRGLKMLKGIGGGGIGSVNSGGTRSACDDGLIVGLPVAAALVHGRSPRGVAVAAVGIGVLRMFGGLPHTFNQSGSDGFIAGDVTAAWAGHYQRIHHGRTPNGLGSRRLRPQDVGSPSRLPCSVFDQSTDPA
ncbi:MAG: hypothetical protein ACYC26_14450 [Phycisphaerales bacterium]